MFGVMCLGIYLLKKKQIIYKKEIRDAILGCLFKQRRE
jgi:hypothetical protein